MPTYEYACRACGQHTEAVQSFTDEALTVCPHCGGSLRKVFGNIGISFKGSGFYKNDSRSSTPGGSSKTATAENGSAAASTDKGTKTDGASKSESAPGGSKETSTTGSGASGSAAGSNGAGTAKGKTSGPSKSPAPS